MNTDQLGIVTSPAKWNMVLAGPGSGKSTVIVARAKQLADQGTKPAEMAFVTFTGIGAKVMRRRLAEAVGQVGFVGTLHSLMLTMLRRSNPRWVLIGEDDANDFLRRHARIMGYRGSEDELQDAKSVVNFGEAVPVTPAGRAVRSYRDFMRRELMLDYDMVLTEGLELIRKNPAVNSWPVWFVDEFQDSSPVDAKIYLTANPEQLMVVGDPDQSIFAFRGARPENVTDFWNDNRFARHILSLNYRCAPQVCSVANGIIAANDDRIKKDTVAAVELDGVCETRFHATDADERHDVASIVRQHIDGGLAPAEVAVLCRTNRLANEMRDELKEAGIQVAEVESERKPKDWPLLMLILSAIAAPDNWAPVRLMSRARARLSKGDADAAEAAVDAHRAKGGSAAAFLSLPSLKVVLSMNADFSRFGISAASHRLLSERIRIYRPETIEELQECLRESPETKSSRGVNVMTVHSAKGEEWNAVIVPGTELFDRRTKSEQSEERRLLFVAATRARRFLTITAARDRKSVLPGGQIITQSRPTPNLFETVVRISKSMTTAKPC